MAKWFVNVVLVGGMVAALAIYCELSYGGTIVVSKRTTHVFKSESAAFREHSINLSHEPPVAVIEQGRQVTVIWDTYRKDYWACYVRTSTGIRGWTLCTDLVMGGSVYLSLERTRGSSSLNVGGNRWCG